MYRTSCADTAVSPIAALDAAFVALSRAPRPVTLPAALLSEQPADQQVPIEQVRTRLIHPSCHPQVHTAVWNAVVARAHREGEPWMTVAAGLAVPGLARILSRLPHLPLLDRAEVEQEILTALIDELAQAEPGEPHPCRRLLKAADRAGHRHVYHHIKHLRTRQTADHCSMLPDAPHRAAAPCSESEAEVDEYTVLWQAVHAQILTADSADLIARTRLDGERIEDLAAERGVTARTLFRRRAAAESRLGQALRNQTLQHPDE